MRRFSTYLLLTGTFLTMTLAGFCGAAESNAGDLPVANLQWRNGDILPGTILPGPPQKLLWKSEAFRDPFQLDTRQLKNISFPESYLGKARSSLTQFRISFTNGDRLYGDLIAIEDDTVTFQCPRMAERIVVKRSFLNRIERVSGSHLRYSGPMELEDWKALGRNATDDDWYVKKNGEFATHRWGGELFREIALPEKLEIAFTLSCPQGMPNFEIGITEDPDAGPRIETWDDTLVLTNGNQFAPISKLSEKTRVIDFRVFWNQEAKEIKVCNIDGEVLASLGNVDFRTEKKAPTSTRSNSSNSRDPNRSGFRLMNRTPEIGFSHLTVREWDGETIPRFDASKPRIEMSGGAILFDLNNLELNSSEGFQVEGRKLPLEKVDQLVFSTGQSRKIEANQSRLTWFDGGVVTGKITVLDHESVSIEPVWLDRKSTARLKNAKELYFPDNREPVVTGSDRMKSDDITISGFLSPGNNGAAHTLLSWKPPGSTNASPLTEERKAEVTREAYPGATEMVGDARLYLTNDEVISGQLIAIEDGTVEFTSYLTGQVSISETQVRAIDIEGARLLANGFEDPGWSIVQDSDEEDLNFPGRDKESETKKKPGVVMTKDKVVMSRDGFAHMNLLVGDRIRFHTKWESNYGVFTMRLFCSDITKESPSTDLLIGAQGNRILVGQLKPGGGFSFSGEQIAIKDQQADIEVLAQHDKVQISVNGKKSLSLDIKPDQISGNGVVFKMGGGWRGWNENPNEVEFSKFSVDRSPGHLPKRIINHDAKINALTIPRFHRESPPTQVLIAPNGDLLRGQLQSARRDKIKFISREAEIELPRSRISAIVWLREPLEEAAPETSDSPPEVPTTPASDDFLVTHQLILHDGTRLHLAAKETASEILVGQSSVLGTCKVPLNKIQRFKQGPAHRLGRTSSSDQLAYTDWVMKLTPDPAVPKGDGSESSPLIGKVAPDMTLTLLKGGEFTLSKQKGRVVVLDFWATWCGPCIRAMPEVFRAVGLFSNQPVQFVAVNQAETPPIISQFLEARGWSNTTVGLDFDLSAGRNYSVKGIPHTVVIGKDGKIAWVHTGFTPDLGKKLAEAIARALQKK